MTDRLSRSQQESGRLPPRSATRRQRFAIDQPIKSQATFGNIVTAVYSALLRELTTKGAGARFVKTGRGKFARRGAE
jgi:hypothetical protein